MVNADNNVYYSWTSSFSKSAKNGYDSRKYSCNNDNNCSKNNSCIFFNGSI